MVEDKPTILIVEDDLDVAEMLNAYFRVQGYDVLTVNWGEDGLRASEASRPDLIILDIRLPDIDGFEVAKRLRNQRNTKNIPIIFLTEKRGRLDRLKGLEIGGDDYITKPFDVQELRLRVRNALQRNTQGTLTNPVTSLPEGTTVNERLEDLINEDDWALLLVSLENLDAFRETYGFVASDDVLRAIGIMIQNAMREFNSPKNYLCHLTTHQFGLITQPNHVPDLSERINTRLEQSLDYFYPLKDRDRIKDKPSRLAIQLGELRADQGPFESIDILKTKLLNQPRK
jgi:DNA-binding response OmpR family regulator